MLWSSFLDAVPMAPGCKATIGDLSGKWITKILRMLAFSAPEEVHLTSVFRGSPVREVDVFGAIRVVAWFEG